MYYVYLINYGSWQLGSLPTVHVTRMSGRCVCKIFKIINARGKSLLESWVSTFITD